MENPTSFVRKGELRLPIGFRFFPTDEELVVHYLKRKALNLPLPASVIPECDVFHVDPWDLPGDWKEKRYFFSKRKWNRNQCNRVPGCGYWKPIGKYIKIVASESNQAVVGLKRSLAFYGGKGRHGTRTPWVMHELTLVCSQINLNSTQSLGMEDWVVCCIFQKEKRSADRRAIAQPDLSCNRTGSMKVLWPSEIDYRAVEDTSCLGPPPPSTCSSGVTETSSNGAEQEETSAITNHSSSHYSRREH